ncbi:MAG: family 16 glycosylhydrolase [Huintestinicola sp.]
MTKKILSALLALAVSVSTASTQNVENSENSERAEKHIVVDGKSCTLSFEDNFDGTELDLSKWERCPEYKRCDLKNYWDDDMSYLDGKGNLVLETSYDADTGKFLSGAVRTRGIFEQAYGYFEIRCDINNVPGYWTAFWLMGDSVNSPENGGVDGTEIDIYESPYYKTSEIQNTLNWDGYGSEHKYEGKITKIKDVYKGYHTFSLLWTEEEYVFYVDGNVTWRTDAKKAEGTCSVPLYMKISSEEGTWAGMPNGPDKNLLPDHMLVDYVRVYTLDSVKQ